jgi:group I intron endonuclease
MTYIYLVENCYGDPNKVYIGKTKNSKTRELNHKIKYGNQITYTEIDNINSLDRKEWEPLETYWIEQFKTWGFDVVNVRKKGGSGVEFHTLETRQKLRKPKPEQHKQKMKGRKFSKETCDKISKAKKGTIYSDDRNKKISEKLKGRKVDWNKKLPVLQYDLEGNFIKEWPSITDTARAGFSFVIGVLRGTQKTASGYKWEYKKS